MKRKLSLNAMKDVQDVPLPPEWKCVQSEIKFERSGVGGEWAVVVYDSLNGVFYVKTSKATVYPDDIKALNEAVKVMDKVNKLIEKL